MSLGMKSPKKTCKPNEDHEEEAIQVNNRFQGIDEHEPDMCGDLKTLIEQGLKFAEMKQTRRSRQTESNKFTVCSACNCEGCDDSASMPSRISAATSSSPSIDDYIDAKAGSHHDTTYEHETHTKLHPPPP